MKQSEPSLTPTTRRRRFFRHSFQACMNEPQEYMIRWRSREAGPFSVEEINRQLDEHEIGMGHEIFYQEAWITLEEFLAPAQPAAPAPIQPTEPSPLPS